MRTTSASTTLSFRSNESGSGFACKLDGGAWVSCASPKSYEALALGTHRFAVRATDAAGNTDASPATRSWTVEAAEPPPPPSPPSPPGGGTTVPETDTTPPDTTITSGPAATTTSTAATFAFAASEAGSSFVCQLDGTGWTGCASPGSFDPHALGTHQFAVRATDAAGNTDPTPATRTWTVEAPAPAPDCTTVVSSVSAAQSAVTAASAGSVVCLANGSYPRLVLSATKPAPGVIVRAQNAGQATIAGAGISGSRLTLARFVSTGSVQIQPGATQVTVEHNRITGGGQGIDAGPTSTTTLNDIAVVGNQLIGPFGEDAIHLNRYHDGDGDGVGILIEGNEITQVRENGNHSDCLQTVWVGDHLVFRDNYLHDNRCQGFFVKDQASLGGVSGPIHGITVEDNLFLRNKEPCAPTAPGCGQPIYFHVFGPYDGFTMTRNTIWGDGYDSIAAFREGTGPDTLIADNVIYRLWTDTNMSGATVRENTVCVLEAGAGGSWPVLRPGETRTCSLTFPGTTTDDYRLAGGRGVDWAPVERHFGP